MPLQPFDSMPGLFVNDQWRLGTPGTYAIVIGVSRYDHLDGSAESYGLDQLHVSALTAYHVFDWLANTYRYDDAPLAQCWFLAAPSPGEREFVGGRGNAARARAFAHAAAATMDEATNAILSWFGTMDALPDDVARRSRSFFFFSGHGLEMTHQRQIALPSDYLRPPRVPNRAISIANLRDGCASLPIRDQFFFLDACRNDHEALRGADVRGVPILQEWGVQRIVGERNAPLMYASASGSSAYAPKNPADGPSLFGQALVHGLRGRPTIQLECTPRDCAVRLYALHLFVGERIQQLLAAFKSKVRQRVPLDGPLLENPVITFVGAPAKLGPRDPARPEADPFSDLPERFSEADATALQMSDRDVRHEVFGSETMAEALDALRIVDFATHASVAPDDYSIVSVRRDDERRRYRIELEIGAGTYFLKVPLLNEPSRSAVACVLSNAATTTYVLDLYRDDQGKLFRIDAEYSTRGGGARIAEVWRLPSSSVAEAVFNIELGALPMAAAILALLHVRARRPIPYRLRKAFMDDATTSDGEVLSFEAALQAGVPWDDELVSSLTDAVHRRGLPVLGESLSYLDRQVHEILEADRVEERMRHATRSALRQLRDRVQKAVRYFRPGSQFVSFVAGDPNALTAALVLPQEKPTTQGSSSSGSSQPKVETDDRDDYETGGQAEVWA